MKDLLQAPDASKAQSAKWRKTLFLWLLLIVMFLAIYQLFEEPNPHHGHAQSAPSISWPFHWTTIVPLTLIVGMVVVLGQRQKRFNRENAEGVALLNKGAAGRAAQIFEGMVTRYRWPRNLGATARFNAGIAQLRLGQLARAIELLTPIAKNKAYPVGAAAAAELAGVLALAGQVEEAAAWLAKAEIAPQAQRNNLVWPRVLVAARRGELVELARMLDDKWRELESALTGEALRRLLLLRAFAAATAAGPRGAGGSELAARLRPVRPGEFAWLTASWPELGAFLAENQLG